MGRQKSGSSRSRQASYAVCDDHADSRLNKELGLYKQEADEQAVRVKDYVDQGRDEWDIRKQEEILRDCEQMIPDTTRRLKDATTELHTYMTGVSEAARQTDEWHKADKALAAVP